MSLKLYLFLLTCVVVIGSSSADILGDLFKFDIFGALTGYDDDDEIAKREDEDSSSQSTCNCNEGKCDCCVDFNISSIIDFGGPACVNIKYISQNEGVALNVSYGDSILHSQTVTDKNKKGTCMSLLSEFAQICARFSELTKVDDGLNGCLNFEPLLFGEISGQYHVGCFKMGPDGMSVDNSAHNSTNEADAEADEEDDDEEEEEGDQKNNINDKDKDTTSPKPDEEEATSFIEAVNQSAEESLAFISNLLGFGSDTKKTKNKSTTTEKSAEVSSTTEPARKRTKGKIRS